MLVSRIGDPVIVLAYWPALWFESAVPAVPASVPADGATAALFV
jgi:hypothetical protein